MKLQSLAGQRFGRLTVLDQHKRTTIQYANSISREISWLCRCDCGTEKWCPARHLRGGAIKSCGCLSAELLAKGRSIVHHRTKRVTVRTRISPTRRKCNKCGKIKPIEQFAPYQGRQAGEHRKTCLNCDHKAAAARAAKWRDSHPEEALSVSRRHEEKRKGRGQTAEQIAYHQSYYETHKEATIARAREWGRANPKKVLANTIMHQKKIRRATPPWVDRRAITKLYAACPPDHSVDHIVPIAGRTIEGYRVSGLHVPWNLQYLPGVENYEKNNRMRPEDQALCEGTFDPVSIGI